MKYQVLFFPFQNSHNCREFKELSINLNFTKNELIILVIMKHLVLLPKLGNHNKNYSQQLKVYTMVEEYFSLL